MAEVKIKVGLDTGNTENTLNGIKRSIKDLRSQALSIGEGGKGFKELTQQANELQDKLDDLKDSSKSLQGTGIEKLNSSFGLLTDSFKNADFGKAKTAFKGLGSAMSAIPIFLILEGIQFIVEKFEIFGQITQVLTDLIYKFTDALGFTSHAAEEKAKAIVEANEKEKKGIEERYNAEIKLAQAAGQEVSHIEQLKLEELENSTKTQLAALQILGIEKGKLNKEETKQYEELQTQLLQLSTDRRAKELEEEKKFNEQRQAYSNLQAGVAETLAMAKMSEREKEVYNIRKQAQARLEELDKKEVFNYQATGAAIEAQLKSNAETRKQIEEIARLEISKVNKKYYVERISDKVKFDTTMQAADEEQADRELAALNKSESDKKEAKEKADADKLNASAMAYEAEEKLYKDALAKQKAADEAAFQARVSNVQKYTSAISSALNSVIGVFQAVADLNKQQAEQDTKERQDKLDADLSNLETAKEAELAKEGLTQEQKAAINFKFAQQEYELKLLEYNRTTEVKKKAFEQDKKLRIAQTVISTITGVVSAVTGMIQAVPGPVGIVLGALAGAAVAAMGAIQVAQISKQKFDAGSPPAAPTLQAPNASNAMGTGNAAQQGPDLYAIEGDTDNGIGGSGQRRGRSSDEPIKAYVVSQEMTASQNKDAVIQRRSSF